MREWKSLALLFSATALLAACGGGDGGGSSPPAAPPPTQADLADADAARLTSLADPAKGSVLLQWTDTFPAGTTYTVESRTAAGAFTSIDTVNGGGHTAPLSWTHPLDGLSTLRVMAHVSTRSVSLKTPSHAETVSATVPAALPAIVVDQVGPLTGNVHVSLDDRSAYRSVAWLHDTTVFATVNTRGAFATWATGAVANGSHALVALLETAPDSRVEIGRDVEVSNSAVHLVADLWGEFGRTAIEIDAKSDAGIQGVMGSLDGAPPVILYAPNSCGRRACWPGENPSLYEFSFEDAATPGAHTLEVTANDHANVSQVLGVPFVIFTTTFTPADGAIVYGTLDLSGSANRDSNRVVVNARLDDVPILTDATSPFETHFDLSGIAPGEHQLVVDVDDVDFPHATIARTLFVASSADMVVMPVMSLGAHGQMLAAEGDLLLYSAVDGNHVRNTRTGADTLLADSATVTDPQAWQIDGGRVFAGGTDSDCPQRCIYEWGPDGSRTNISALDPAGGVFHLTPYARYGAVVWKNLEDNSITLYDVANATYTRIVDPGIGNISSWILDRFNGVIHVYSALEYSAIDDWSQATGQTTTVSTCTSFCYSPQSDGARLVWEGVEPTHLYVYPLAGGDIGTLGDGWLGGSDHARDGVITWIDDAVFASDASGAITILSSASLNGRFESYGTAAGVVAFADQGGLETWSALTGITTRRLDAWPNQAVLTAYTLYFSVAESNVVYKIAPP